MIIIFINPFNPARPLAPRQPVAVPCPKTPRTAERRAWQGAPLGRGAPACSLAARCAIGWLPLGADAKAAFQRPVRVARLRRSSKGPRAKRGCGLTGFAHRNPMALPRHSQPMKNASRVSGRNATCFMRRLAAPERRGISRL